MRGDEVLRVTARKDQWGEVEDNADGTTAWICNECRYDKKQLSDWTIEGPSKIDQHSVISANHYETLKNIKADTLRMLGSKPTGVKVELGTGALDPNNE